MGLAKDFKKNDLYWYLVLLTVTWNTVVCKVVLMRYFADRLCCSECCHSTHWLLREATSMADSSSCSIPALLLIWALGPKGPRVSAQAGGQLCLSILLIVPFSLLLIILIQKSSLRQPYLNQHSHVPSLSISVSTTDQTGPLSHYSLSYYPLLHWKRSLTRCPQKSWCFPSA